MTHPLLEELEATPLLGRGLARADALWAEVHDAIEGKDLPELRLRLLILDGLLGLATGDPETAISFRLAERQVSDPDERLRLRLLRCRALAAQGSAGEARALLALCRPGIVQRPPLRADLCLAEAATGHQDRRTLWTEALDLLPSPSRDHDRLNAHLSLGTTPQVGADLHGARHHLEQALLLVRHYEDLPGEARVRSLLGSLAIQMGLLPAARDHLERALELATELNDDLLTTTVGLLLSGLIMDTGQWAAALDTCQRTSSAAGRRGNWLAVASAGLSASTCLLKLEGAEIALRNLLELAQVLYEARLPAAQRLVKARLAELRGSLGKDVFDPALRQAMKALREEA